MKINERILHSSEGARSYRIRIACPSEPAPAEGYPVIYLLDANAVFGTMTEAVRVQGSRPERTGVNLSIVVGIGYLVDEPFPPERHFDFTLAALPEELPLHPEGKEWPPQGGAEPFLRFIEEELKPAIAQDYPVNSSETCLIGHSLGGLFVLYALFKRPGSFRTYVAGSPSIHWHERRIREEEAEFPNRLEAAGELRLLLAVGELERRPGSRMNDNAQDLADRLNRLNVQHLHVEYREYSDDNHVSLLPALLSRAIRFASKA